MLHLPELPRVGQQVLSQLKSRSTSDSIQAPPSSGTRENHHPNPCPPPHPLHFRFPDPCVAAPIHRSTAPPRARRVPVRQARSEDTPSPASPPNGRRRPQIERGAGGACRSRSGGRAWTRSPPPPWRARCPRSSCWTSRAASSSGATTAATSPRSRPSASSPSSSTRR